MTFAYPWVLTFPILLALLEWRRRSLVQLVSFPSLQVIPAKARNWKARLRQPILSSLRWLMIVCLSVAAARPQEVEHIKEQYKARNIMLALDISGSMRTSDFMTSQGRASRLEAVKYVVRQFIEARADDRLGLVVFGSGAFLQAPLTFDHRLVSEMVDNLEVGLAGDGTAIGDGLGLAVKRIEDSPGDSKAVILLTDGVNNAGAALPLQAAEVAKDLKIKVHTIGVGRDGRQAASDIFDMLGTAFSQQAEYDETTLKKIAEISGGVFFNASSLQGLLDVYQKIDQLEQNDAERLSQILPQELFEAWAWAAALIFILLVLLNSSIFLKIP